MLNSYQVRFVSACAWLLFLFTLPGGRAHESVLINGSEAQTVILLAPGACSVEGRAAQTLQSYLLRMTGVRVPLVRELKPDANHVISVGHTGLVHDALRERVCLGRKLIFADSRRDSFIINSAAGIEDRRVLYLLGHRPQATLFAVYEFLEMLGCRWYFAYEAGWQIPELERVAIGELDVYRQPDFALRIHYTWGGNARAAAVDEKEEYWFAASRMSERGPLEGSSAHNFSQIWPVELFERQPELFPLVYTDKEKIIILPDIIQGDPDELEVQDLDILLAGEDKEKAPRKEWRRVRGSQRCLSSPEVIRLGTEWALRRIAENPDHEMVPFIQNDGMTGFCQCEECRRLGNFADQNIYLANQVGRFFFAEHPEKMIHIISYFESARIPRLKVDGFAERQDRVWVTIFSNFAKVPYAELIPGWAQVSNNLEVADAWQFFSGELTRNPDCPRTYSQRLQNYAFFKKNNVVAIKTIVKSDWARHGLARYLSAKLMWDVNADVEALKKDFYHHMFPNAAADFALYMALYEEVENGGLDIGGFLLRAFPLLEKIRRDIRLPRERDRWEFYALYLHALVLGEELNRAGNAYERLQANREMGGFLKAVEHRGILESSQRIGIILLPRITKLRHADIQQPDPPRTGLPALEKQHAPLFTELEEPVDEVPSKSDSQMTWHERRRAMLNSIQKQELTVEMVTDLFLENLENFTSHSEKPRQID